MCYREEKVGSNFMSQNGRNVLSGAYHIYSKFYLKILTTMLQILAA